MTTILSMTTTDREIVKSQIANRKSKSGSNAAQQIHLRKRREERRRGRLPAVFLSPARVCFFHRYRNTTTNSDGVKTFRNHRQLERVLKRAPQITITQESKKPIKKNNPIQIQNQSQNETKKLARTLSTAGQVCSGGSCLRSDGARPLLFSPARVCFLGLVERQKKLDGATQSPPLDASHLHST